MPLLICFILAFMITRAISDGKTDRELARKGIVSPRLQAKYGDGARAKTAQYGLVDYLADAWSDQWRNRTDIRRAAEKAVGEATPSKPGAAKPSWRDKLAAVKKAAAVAGRKLIEPVEAKPRPARTPDPAPAVDEPEPVDVDVHRTCPDCGAHLTDTGGEWWHPDGPHCPKKPTAAGKPLTDPPCGICRRPFSEHVITDVGDDEPVPVCPTRPTAATDPAGDDPAACARCGRPLHRRWKRSVGGAPVCRYGCNSAEQPPPRDCTCPICVPNTPDVPDSNGGTRMTAPTGEAVNYETTVAELEAILAEQRKWLDAATVGVDHAQGLSAAFDGIQTGYKGAAAATGNVNQHLQVLLPGDTETLAQVGTAGDAMSPNDVDTFYAHIEAMEVEAKRQKANAEVAVASTEAALRRVTEEYGEEAAKVANNMGGDPSFLGSGAPSSAAA